MVFKTGGPLGLQIEKPITAKDLPKEAVYGEASAREAESEDVHFYKNAKGRKLQKETSIQSGRETTYSGPMSIVNDFGKRAQETLSRRISEIKSGLEARINRIRDLHQEKYKVMRSVYTREELADLAIKAFAEAKERNKKDWLIKHLEDCRQHKRQLFNDTIMGSLFNERDIPKLFLFLTTEDDVRAAIDALPNDGVSKKEREKQLKQIDDEIQNLSRELEAEMAKTEGDLKI